MSEIKRTKAQITSALNKHEKGQNYGVVAEVQGDYGVFKTLIGTPIESITSGKDKGVYANTNRGMQKLIGKVETVD